jgi:hypothetical protein
VERFFLIPYPSGNWFANPCPVQFSRRPAAAKTARETNARPDSLLITKLLLNNYENNKSIILTYRLLVLSSQP